MYIPSVMCNLDQSFRLMNRGS